MKILAIAALLAAAATAAPNPQIRDVHTVYILPMGAGMDQYLASRLTARGALQVVSDPQKADAVFTDHLGPSFEARMNELYPPETAAADKDKDKEADKEKKGAGSGKTFGTAPPPPVSSFTHGRGSFFLVDRKTRSVLWSIYESPRSTRPDDLNHTADRVAQAFAKSVNQVEKHGQK